ncbi:MAG: hypothetical protein ACYC6N_27955, partial [Pirellulaceae bacterium]
MKYLMLFGFFVLTTMLAVGCTKSPTTSSKSPESGDAGRKESAAGGQSATVSSADTKEMAPPSLDGSPAPADPPVTPSAGAGVPQFPYEDLIASLGDPEAVKAYRQIEEQMAADPADPEARVVRAQLVSLVGAKLLDAGKQEQGLKACAVGLELAEAVVAAEPSLPDYLARRLTTPYFNGACAQSMGGKPEEAQAT